MTDVTTEMPRARSISIQSERVWRRLALARTSPASWIAPPNSSIFSVRVVLPASGCEIMAKVRRRATGFGSGISESGFEGIGASFSAGAPQGEAASAAAPDAASRLTGPALYGPRLAHADGTSGSDARKPP